MQHDGVITVFGVLKDIGEELEVMAVDGPR